jgi:propionate CoA-transferase
MELGERKIIGRRCAFELPLGGVINLGIGMPESLAAVAAEENVLKLVTLTAEPGVIGGIPQGGLNFGACLNPSAIIQQNQQFDFYDGGGLDMACLGMAQADQAGNVNVSLFGNRLAGSGGFINISQNAKKVLFAGTFTTGGLHVSIEDGNLKILREGKSRKFLRHVEQITYSGAFGSETKQPAYYVTERCVFKLTVDGLELIEFAPGIDIERDIIAHMDFRPIVNRPTVMDSRIFQPSIMGLERVLAGLSIAERITYDQSRNILFLNYEGLHLKTLEDIEQVRAEIESRCRSIGKRVTTIANYEGFELDQSVSDAYFTLVAYIQSRYYKSVSRYTTNAFMRLKLSDALAQRELGPVFETGAEAHRAVGEAERPA